MRIREGTPADARDGAGAVRRGGALARGARADRPVGHGAVLGLDARVARAAEWAAGGGLRIACEGDEAVGAIVIGARPEHVSPADSAERYVEALVTVTRPRRARHRRRARPPRDQGDADRRDPAAAGRLLGGCAVSGRVVRASGLPPQRDLHRERLARPGPLDGRLR